MALREFGEGCLEKARALASELRRSGLGLLRVLGGLLLDLLGRDRTQLALRNAFLQSQLEALLRQERERNRRFRTRPTDTERGLMALLSRYVPWRKAGLLRIVNGDTLVGWHRKGFRYCWWIKSGRPSGARSGQRTPEETRALIRAMAIGNPRWGAERIVDQLWEFFSIRIHEKTVQKILKGIRPRRPRTGQTMGTFVRNHLEGTWACDFLTVPSATFKLLFVFFVLRIDTRQILHVNVTTNPTDAWVAHQFREVTPFGEGPRCLIRDDDSKYGKVSDEVIRGCETKTHIVPCTGNVFAERWVKSIRRELLDHLIPRHEDHLRGKVQEYLRYFNRLRPHQGVGRVPDRAEEGPDAEPQVERRTLRRVVVTPLLGGLVNHFAPDRPLDLAA